MRCHYTRAAYAHGVHPVLACLLAPGSATRGQQASVNEIQQFALGRNLFSCKESIYLDMGKR